MSRTQSAALAGYSAHDSENHAALLAARARLTNVCCLHVVSRLQSA